MPTPSETPEHESPEEEAARIAVAKNEAVRIQLKFLSLCKYFDQIHHDTKTAHRVLLKHIEKYDKLKIYDKRTFAYLSSPLKKLKKVSRPGAGLDYGKLPEILADSIHFPECLPIMDQLLWTTLSSMHSSLDKNRAGFEELEAVFKTLLSHRMALGGKPPEYLAPHLAAALKGTLSNAEAYMDDVYRDRVVMDDADGTIIQWCREFPLPEQKMKHVHAATADKQYLPAIYLSPDQANLIARQWEEARQVILQFEETLAEQHGFQPDRAIHAMLLQKLDPRKLILDNTVEYKDAFVPIPRLRGLLNRVQSHKPLSHLQSSMYSCCQYMDQMFAHLIPEIRRVQFAAADTPELDALRKKLTKMLITRSLFELPAQNLSTIVHEEVPGMEGCNESLRKLFPEIRNNEGENFLQELSKRYSKPGTTEQSGMLTILEQALQFTYKPRLGMGR